MYSGTFVPLLAGQAWEGNTKVIAHTKERYFGKNYRYKFIGLLGHDHERQNKSVAM